MVLVWIKKFAKERRKRGVQAKGVIEVEDAFT